MFVTYLHLQVELIVKKSCINIVSIVYKWISIRDVILVYPSCVPSRIRFKLKKILADLYKEKNQVKVGNKLKVNDQSNHVHSNWLIFFFLISDFHTKFLMNVAQMHKRLSRPPWEVQSSINFHIVILFLCMLIENGRLSYLKS